MYPTHNTFEPAVINTHWFAKIAACLRTNGCRMEPPIMTPSMWICGNLPQASPCACWLLQCWGKMVPLYTLCAWRRTIKDRWKGKHWMLFHSVTPTVCYGGEFEHGVQRAPQVWQLICERRWENRTKLGWLRSHSSSWKKIEFSCWISVPAGLSRK